MERRNPYINDMKLTKSQRVTVIQDIANHLSDHDWTYVDLVLKQFGFPTSDNWNGSTSGYVVSMINDAEDDDLIELGEHFGMTFPGKEPTPLLDGSSSPQYWQEGHLKVFISHLTAEKEQASEVRRFMKRYGMSGFVAHSDIHPTAEWQLEVETALATCDLLVALIHPGFATSKWCDQEIGYALGRGVPVFAVRCGADPHGFVSRFQAFSGSGKASIQIAKEIFEAAIHHKKLQDKMSDIVIDLFIASGSFASAKERVAYVEGLEKWDPSYSARIAKSVKVNDQISGSWGVPDQVAAIVNKWK